MTDVPTTLVFSDIHLTTAEQPDPERPLWKRYKHPDLFVDDDIAAMLQYVRDRVNGPLEIILDGDIFDFDAVTQHPENPDFPVTWLERLRGLHPTQAKSAWKLSRILDDHPVFVRSMRELLAEGHSVVFIVGNHDLELLWPAVQDTLTARLTTGPDEDLRVCDWFYVSNADTLVEHGNQYDSYCLAQDPLWPTVRVPPHREERMRLPFGNYASRYMINGMGMINPYLTEAFIMPFWGYVVFFWRHVARAQPFLLWTWLWSASVTFWASLRDGLLPAETDVLRLDARVDEVARRAKATPRLVRGLYALRAHSAVFHPWKVARELWLDRALLLMLVLGGTFQLITTMNAMFGVSLWWWLVVLFVGLVPFVFYAQRVSSDVFNQDRAVRKRIRTMSRLAGVERLVMGHSHLERHTVIEGVEYLNAGTWSPSFRDVACTEKVGRKCVVRIAPLSSGTRVAFLEEWTGDGFVRLPREEEVRKRGLVDAGALAPQTARQG